MSKNLFYSNAHERTDDRQQSTMFTSRVESVEKQVVKEFVPVYLGKLWKK